jgi:HEAT repeat protein
LSLLAAVLVPLVLLHLCYGAVLAALARRLGAARAGWAWAPGLNLLLPFALAGRSPAWGALLLVPALNVIVWVQLWAEVFARLGRPSWTALAMAVPGVNLLWLARVAGMPPARVAAAAAVAIASLFGAWFAQARGEQARVAEQVRRLSDPLVEERRAAAAALAGGRPAAAVAPLSAALRDGDAEVRRESARALARLGARASAAGPELQDLLRRESEPAVRVEAARALHAIGGEAVTSAPLEPLVGGLLDAARGSAERDMPDVTVVDALAELGHAAVPHIVAALRDGDPGVRWHASAALMHLGRRAAGHAPALRQAMDDPVWIVRNAAGRALEEVCGPEDLPALVQAVGDASVETRYHAARALARLGYDAAPAVPALAVALRDEDWEVRTEAVRALGTTGHAAAAALPDLLIVLDGDADEQVREAAAWALGALEPSPAATEALRRARSDPAVRVRRAAARVLAGVPRTGS